MTDAIIWLVIWFVLGILGTGLAWFGFFAGVFGGFFSKFVDYTPGKSSKGFLIGLSCLFFGAAWTVFWIVQVVLQIVSIVKLVIA